MDKKIAPILGFIAGVLVGMNWPKIEKFIKPYLKAFGEGSTDLYSGLATFLAQQKENVEDMVAESKIKKGREGEGVEEVITAKKTTKKRKPKSAEKRPRTLKKQFLKIRVKQAINKYPEGVTLQKMAEEIGVHFIRLSRPVKELLEKNKIRKEGKLYFPIS